MQLVSLYIKDYRILHDFKIDFSKDFNVEDSLNVIIGENGAGKTTLIECLLKIFSSLYNCKTVEDFAKIKNKINFEFTISYFTKAEKEVESTSNFSNQRVDYVKVTFSNINKDWLILDYEDKQLVNKDVNNFLFKSQYTLQDLLPKNTVLYYSGFDNRLSDFANKYATSYFKEWFTFLENDSKGISINSPVFNFDPSQFNLLLFALFCTESNEISSFITNKFSIVGFTEIKLKLKMPSWNRGNSSETFWGAKGIFMEALLKFKNASQESNIQSKYITFSYFIPDVLLGLVNQGVDESFSSEKEIFQSLVAFEKMDLLDDIEITLVKTVDNKNIEISSSNLSEGEKQLISIYGLKKILSANEGTLFLFDEPDTFLHPKWKKDFFKNIYSSNENNIHYGDFDIITTHSPEIIGGISSNDSLKLMENGKILSKSIFVKGRDYNSILNSAFNSLKRNEYGDELLNKFYKSLENEQFEIAKSILIEIIKSFGSDDIETQRAIENLDDNI